MASATYNTQNPEGKIDDHFFGIDLTMKNYDDYQTTRFANIVKAIQPGYYRIINWIRITGTAAAPDTTHSGYSYRRAFYMDRVAETLIGGNPTIFTPAVVFGAATGPGGKTNANSPTGTINVEGNGAGQSPSDVAAHVNYFFTNLPTPGDLLKAVSVINEPGTEGDNTAYSGSGTNVWYQNPTNQGDDSHTAAMHWGAYQSRFFYTPIKTAQPTAQFGQWIGGHYSGVNGDGEAKLFLIGTGEPGFPHGTSQIGFYDKAGIHAYTDIVGGNATIQNQLSALYETNFITGKYGSALNAAIPRMRSFMDPLTPTSSPKKKIYIDEFQIQPGAGGLTPKDHLGEWSAVALTAMKHAVPNLVDGFCLMSAGSDDTVGAAYTQFAVRTGTFPTYNYQLLLGFFIMKEFARIFRTYKLSVPPVWNSRTELTPTGFATRGGASDQIGPVPSAQAHMLIKEDHSAAMVFMHNANASSSITKTVTLDVDPVGAATVIRWTPQTAVPSSSDETAVIPRGAMTANGRTFTVVLAANETVILEIPLSLPRLVPQFDSVIAAATQGLEEVGHVRNRMRFWSNSTKKWNFSDPKGVPAPARRLIKVNAQGSQPDWWQRLGFTWPSASQLPVVGGVKFDWANVAGDVGVWGDTFNGHVDGTTPHISDPVSAIRGILYTPQSVFTTLAQPYTAGDTVMHLTSSQGLPVRSWNPTAGTLDGVPAGAVNFGASVQAGTFADRISWQGITGNDLTGIKTDDITHSYPTGTKVYFDRTGFVFVLQQYNKAVPWHMPDGTPGQFYPITVHAVFGRKDGISLGTSTAQGQLFVWQGASDNKVIDLANVDTLQRVTDWYKSPGNPHTQEYVEFFDGGPEVAYGSLDYPTILTRQIATQFGNTLSEAIVDLPQLGVRTTLAADMASAAATATVSDASMLDAAGAVTLFSGTSRVQIKYTSKTGNVLNGVTGATIFMPSGATAVQVSGFEDNQYFELSDGTPYGQTAHHVAVGPDRGPSGINIAFSGGQPIGVSVPRFDTGQFPIPPSLGGTQPSTQPPVITQQPTIAGVFTPGNTISTNQGVYSGNPTIQDTIQFTSDGVNYFDHPNSIGGSVLLSNFDIGLKFRVKETAFNAAGSAPTVFSSPSAILKSATGDLMVDPNLTAIGTGGWAPYVGTPGSALPVITQVAGTPNKLHIVTPGNVPFEGAITPVGRGTYLPPGVARKLMGKVQGTVGDVVRVSIGTYKPNGDLVRTSPVTMTLDGTVQDIGSTGIIVPQASEDSYQLVLVSTPGTAAAITFDVWGLTFADFVAAPAQPTVLKSTSKPQGPSQTGSMIVNVTAGGTNKMLLFYLQWDTNSRPLAATFPKYDGVSMTQVGTTIVNQTVVTCWRVMNPTVGDHTITWQTGGPTQTVQWIPTALEISGVNTGTPIGTVVNASLAVVGTHPAVTVPSAQNDLIVAALTKGASGTETMTPDANQVDRWNTRQYTNYGIHGAGATKAGTGGNVTIGWTTQQDNNPAAIMVVPIKGVPAVAAPTNTAVPVIAGTAAQGGHLDADDGGWLAGATAPTSFAYQWYRDHGGTGSADIAIASATSRSYSPTIADVGCKLRMEIVASNAGGVTVATTALTAAVTGVAPVQITPPVVSGPTTLASTLGVQLGTYNNVDVSTTYDIFWEEDDKAWGAFTTIVGETNPTYDIVPADDNKRFRVRVEVTNAWGTLVVYSNIVGPVGPDDALDNFNRINQPTLTDDKWGVDIQGGGGVDPMLLEDNEIRTSTLLPAQAYRKDIADRNVFCEIGVPVAPTTSGHGIGAWGRVQNPGTASAAGYAFDFIYGSGFTFFKLTGGSSFAQPLAYNASHVLADGERLRLEVVEATLTGYYRQTDGTLVSVMTWTDPSPLAGLGTIGLETNDPSVKLDNALGGEFNVNPPTNTAIPTILAPDGLIAGKQIFVAVGTWDGSPGEFFYQFRRDGVDIDGAVADTYVLQPEDVGHVISVGVIAANRAGNSAVAYSAGTAAIAPDPPVNQTPPTLTGKAESGEVLTANPGLWDGDPLPTFEYQYQRSPDDGTTWFNIAGGVGQQYVPTNSEVANLIRVQVAANNGAQVLAYTAPIGPITQKVPPPPPPFTPDQHKSYAARLYRSVGPMTWDDANQRYALAKFVGAIGAMYQPVEDYSRDQVVNGRIRPGWSQILDPLRCPVEALPYLAQYVGVVLDPRLSETDQRAAIVNAGGWRRGTPGAFRAAALPYLTGNRTFILRERYLGDAYRVVAITYASETPDPNIVLKRLLEAKPAALVLNYQVHDGQDFEQIYENYATFQEVYDAYTTFEGILEDQPGA